MSKIAPERAALIERIKAAAAALEIPQEVADHVSKHGTATTCLKRRRCYTISG